MIKIKNSTKKSTFFFHKCTLKDEQNGNLTQKPYTALSSTGESLTCFEGQSFQYEIDASGTIMCGHSNNIEYANNDNQGCRLAACQIERAFAYDVVAFLQNPVEFRDSAKPDGKYKINPNSNDFDASRADICQKSGGSHVQDSCCGEYPQRFPYASSRSVCCDGMVSPIGSC